MIAPSSCDDCRGARLPAAARPLHGPAVLRRGAARSSPRSAWKPGSWPRRSTGPVVSRGTNPSGRAARSPAQPRSSATGGDRRHVPPPCDPPR